MMGCYQVERFYKKKPYVIRMYPTHRRDRVDSGDSIANLNCNIVVNHYITIIILKK